MFCLITQSVALVTDEGNNHAVEVEEEHQKVEAQLDEGFLEQPYVSILDIPHQSFVERTFLCTFSLRKISVASNMCWLS